MYNGVLNGASINQVYVKNIKFKNSYFAMNILSSITMDQFILRDFILIYSIKDSKWFDVLILSNLFYHGILIQLGLKKKKMYANLMVDTDKRSGMSWCSFSRNKRPCSNGVMFP